MPDDTVPTHDELDEVNGGVPDNAGGFPLNRIVAFAGPYIATASGALASWLLVHVHFLGLFHFQHDGLATGLAQGLTFALVTLLTYAGQHKWLDGWQKWEQGLLVKETAEAAVVVPVPPAPPQVDYDPAAEKAALEGEPSIAISGGQYTGNVSGSVASQEADTDGTPEGAVGAKPGDLDAGR